MYQLLVAAMVATFFVASILNKFGVEGLFFIKNNGLGG